MKKGMNAAVRKSAAEAMDQLKRVSDVVSMKDADKIVQHAALAKDLVKARSETSVLSLFRRS